MEKKKSIECDRDLSENDIINLINENENIRKLIDDKKIFKTIFVKNRIINFIIK